MRPLAKILEISELNHLEKHAVLGGNAALLFRACIPWFKVCVRTASHEDQCETTPELRHAMTCKIERVLTPGGFVVFRVSGRIDCAYVELLQELIESEKTAKDRLALDLTE